MKTLMTAVIIAATSTAAMANNSVTWNGNTGNLHQDGCVFDKHQNGTMTLSGTTWTVTTPAKIRVKSKNINNIKVNADDTLLNTDFGVDVNYAGSEVESNKNGITTNINNDEIALGNVNKNGRTITTITIGGTAEMDADDVDLLDNNTNYSIKHTVTCLQ